MLNAVRRLTWLKIAACFIVVYTVLHIYRQPGRPSPRIADRPPLASFVHRPYYPRPSAVSLNNGKIPKIVHQTWKSQSDLPETFRPWMSSWLRHNKDWQYWLWTNDDIRLLITTVFPQYLSIFDSYPAQAYRVDAFRRDRRLALSVVYTIGVASCWAPGPLLPAIDFSSSLRNLTKYITQ